MRAEALPPVALLAGGLATRLGAATATIPKSLLPVAGEPFLAHQLRWLRSEGVREVVICCGHRAGQVRTFAGNGNRFGLRVRYSEDGALLLGTGGAVRKALPMLGERFFVLYGDSYLSVSLTTVWKAFRSSGKLALMTVFRNENRWDKSNVEYVDAAVRCYNKERRTASMRHIDYGLGLLSREALAQCPADEPFDLATVYARLAATDELAAFEASERFYEIGSERGLFETDAHLRGRRPATEDKTKMSTGAPA